VTEGDIHLLARATWIIRHQKDKTILDFWILMKQEMMGWQLHQLDHMQLICTSLQKDSHAITLSLIFYKSDVPDAQPTVSKH